MCLLRFNLLQDEYWTITRYTLCFLFRMPIISCCLLHGVPMVAEEVYCFIAPDGVSIFTNFSVFYLLSSSRRLHRLSTNLTARDYIRVVMLTVFVMTLAICIICQFAALLPLVTSQTRPRSDVLEPQPGITAGESRMFLALGVQDRFPVVLSASLHRLGFM